MGAFTISTRSLRQSGIANRVQASRSVSRSTSGCDQFRYLNRRTLILEPAPECVRLARLADSDKGIVEVRLERPEAKNAIGKEMLRGLRHHLGLISEDASANVVLLTSCVPKVFCAGADLKERREMNASEIHSFVNSLRSTFSFLEALQVPTIAVIEGAALGGGLEMALSCDIRICGENAVMGLPETSLAIIPGAGGTQRLPRLVGKSTAKELIYTGRRVTGREALTLGLVNHCAPAGEAHAKALEIARNINEKGPLALRMAKRAIDRGLEADKESAMEVEEDCYVQLLNTTDRLEGLAAFAEKRKPVYKGE
uniref:Enoyl-CoA hydratase n=1 Tax=Kalanchoe fedtschenkoi TaxID=63787 RepID=A0A7N0RD46_KALFE